MRFAIVASEIELAQQARRKLIERYGDVPVAEAEVIIALGGDGFMLRTLHAHRGRGIPVYGMKLGRVGFLMNKYRQRDLVARVAQAHVAELHPLEMRVRDGAGKLHTALAFNEVSLLRQSNQAAHLEIKLNGVLKLPVLICDGILVSTPAGSTASNLSVHGPIASHRGPHPGAGCGQAPGQCHGGFSRGARRAHGDCPANRRRRAAPALRSRAQPRAAHSRRTVCRRLEAGLDSPIAMRA